MIVDAMFYLRTLVNPPVTYGGIAEKILKDLCPKAQEVHFVADRYITPSIKYIEHSKRGSSVTIIKITGREQIRPNNWHY